VHIPKELGIFPNSHTKSNQGEIATHNFHQGRCLLARGQTQHSTLQQCTKKSLTTCPFVNTYEADEVSPEEEAGVVARLICMQP
jgi:hypothetical protein